MPRSRCQQGWCLLFGFRQFQLLLYLLVVVPWHVSCVLTSYSHTSLLGLVLTLMTLSHSVTSLKTYLQIQLHSEVLGIIMLLYDFIFGSEISINVLGTF